MKPPDPGSDTGRSQYSFSSQWQLPASRDRVWRMFEDLLATDDPFIWWPGLHTERRDGPDIHADIHAVATSPVGYRLRFRVHDLVETPKEKLELSADGDLRGRAVMLLSSIGDERSTLDITWHVEVTRRWMRVSGVVLRPLFVLAHDVAMRQGRRGLIDWLDQHSRRDSDPVG